MSGPGFLFHFYFLCSFPGLLVYSCLCSPEIVLHREANKNRSTVDPPEFDDPAFRALVEENVKDSAFNIIISPVMQQHWSAYIAQEQAQNTTSHRRRRSDDTGAPLKPVYVHGESFLSSVAPHPGIRADLPDLLYLDKIDSSFCFFSSQQVSYTTSAPETSSTSGLPSVPTGVPPRLPQRKLSSAPSTDMLVTTLTCEIPAHQLIRKNVAHAHYPFTFLGAKRRGLNETSRNLFFKYCSWSSLRPSSSSARDLPPRPFVIVTERDLIWNLIHQYMVRFEATMRYK